MEDTAPAPTNINCFGEDLVKEWKKYNSTLTKMSNHFIIIADMITMIGEKINEMAKLYDHTHYNHYHMAGHGASSSSTGFSSQPTICLTTPFPPIEALLSEQYSGEKVTENITVPGLFTQDYFFSNGPDFLTSPSHDSAFNIPTNVNWENFDEFVSTSLYTALNPRPSSTDIMPPKPSENYKRNELFPGVKSTPVENTNTWTDGVYSTGIIDTNISSNVTPSTSRLIRRLIAELATEIDQDDNGLIYGVDFIIDPADPRCPELLTRIRNSKIRNREIKINKGHSNLAVNYPRLFSWNDYLLTLGLGIPNIVIDLRVPSRSKYQILSDLVNESITLIDQDNDGFVYGRDFIIVGPNTPIELKSKYPVLLPNILLTWDAYLSYSQYQFNNNIDVNNWKDMLINEYNVNKDLDGNGKIFGIDFLISDPNDNVQYGLKIENPLPKELFNFTRLDIPKINWNEYIISLNVFPEQSKAYYYDELSVKLSTEFHSVKNNKPRDMDDNNLIYGLDFMLIDYCPDKTGYLWTIEDNERFIIKRDIPVLKKLKDMFDLPKYMKEEYSISDYENLYGTYTPDDSDVDLGSYPYPYETDYKECINNIRKQMMQYSNNDPKQNLSNVPKSLKFPKNILLVTWADVLKINNLKYEV